VAPVLVRVGNRRYLCHHLSVKRRGVTLDQMAGADSYCAPRFLDSQSDRRRTPPIIRRLPKRYHRCRAAALMTAPTAEALKLQRPLPDGMLRIIVAHGTKEDGAASAAVPAHQLDHTETLRRQTPEAKARCVKTVGERVVTCVSSVILLESCAREGLVLAES
jgi:hypothetical protein